MITVSLGLRFPELLKTYDPRQGAIPEDHEVVEELQVGRQLEDQEGRQDEGRQVEVGRRPDAQHLGEEAHRRDAQHLEEEGHRQDEVHRQEVGVHSAVEGARHSPEDLDEVDHHSSHQEEVGSRPEEGEGRSLTVGLEDLI